MNGGPKLQTKAGNGSIKQAVPNLPPLYTRGLPSDRTARTFFYHAMRKSFEGETSRINRYNKCMHYVSHPKPVPTQAMPKPVSCSHLCATPHNPLAYMKGPPSYRAACTMSPEWSYMKLEVNEKMSDFALPSCERSVPEFFPSRHVVHQRCSANASRHPTKTQASLPRSTNNIHPCTSPILECSMVLILH